METQGVLGAPQLLKWQWRCGSVVVRVVAVVASAWWWGRLGGGVVVLLLILGIPARETFAVIRYR